LYDVDYVVVTPLHSQDWTCPKCVPCGCPQRRSRRTANSVPPAISLSCSALCSSAALKACWRCRHSHLSFSLCIAACVPSGDGCFAPYVRPCWSTAALTIRYLSHSRAVTIAVALPCAAHGLCGCASRAPVFPPLHAIHTRFLCSCLAARHALALRHPACTRRRLCCQRKPPFFSSSSYHFSLPLGPPPRRSSPGTRCAESVPRRVPRAMPALPLPPRATAAVIVVTVDLEAEDSAAPTSDLATGTAPRVAITRCGTCVHNAIVWSVPGCVQPAGATGRDSG
jgi:hypothetical protein